VVQWTSFDVIFNTLLDNLQAEIKDSLVKERKSVKTELKDQDLSQNDANAEHDDNHEEKKEAIKTEKAEQDAEDIHEKTHEFRFPDLDGKCPPDVSFMDYTALKNFLKSENICTPTPARVELDKLKIATLSGMVEKLNVS